ncbi:MAG: acylphosphatase, partial [Methanospirillum sp.]|nr:acylphosphatase [Methanospirillum sp.]
MDGSSGKDEKDLKRHFSSKSKQSQQEYMEGERDLYHMIRLNIVVSGEVQRVGFRDRVRRIARLHNITGQVRNCEGYDVEIVAEGLEKDLQNFTQAIKIDEDPIRVESLHINTGI